MAKTWGGPAGLAASGHAYGAFDGDRLAAVTCTFFRGLRHDDAGVVTEPELRGRGLGTASALAWCAGILAQGRVPTWTTSVDNAPSRGIAERLGFELVRRDVLHVIGIEVPPVATYDEHGRDTGAPVGNQPDAAEAPGPAPTR